MLWSLTAPNVPGRKWDVLQAEETTQQNKPSWYITTDWGKNRLDNHRSVISHFFFLFTIYHFRDRDE